MPSYLQKNAVEVGSADVARAELGLPGLGWSASLLT